MLNDNTFSERMQRIFAGGREGKSPRWVAEGLGGMASHQGLPFPRVCGDHLINRNNTLTPVFFRMG